MKLKILRWLEELFYSIGSFFEDWADVNDPEFLEQLRQAAKLPPIRTLGPYDDDERITLDHLKAKYGIKNKDSEEPDND